MLIAGTDGTRIPPFEMRGCGSAGGAIGFNCVATDTGVPACEIDMPELVECDEAIGRAGVADGGRYRVGCCLLTTVCRIGVICC